MSVSFGEKFFLGILFGGGSAFIAEIWKALFARIAYFLLISTLFVEGEIASSTLVAAFASKHVRLRGRNQNIMSR